MGFKGWNLISIYVLSCLLLAGTPASASDKKEAARRGAVSLPPEKASPVRLPRFDSPPVIDGKLDDGAWKRAAVFSGFVQISPGDNIPPSRPTEVMIGYDSKNLYIAFHAYDDPKQVRATLAKRDAIYADDYVGVLLDTYNDKRRAYELDFNPLGVQADAIYTDDPSGRNQDFSLDIVMESKGMITEDGYTVEAAVPFKSLRYVAGRERLWGFHAYRAIKHIDNEQDWWMPISRTVSGRLIQAGSVTGLEGIPTEHTLEAIPTLTFSEEGRRVRTLPAGVVEANPGLIDPGKFVNKPLKADPGLTLKVGLTPTVTLDFAVNPDFAQVEADQPVVTANQRFPIFFAEKRPFFLEGADIFQTPLQAVHTRAIIDPDYAVKLTGKRGRNSFGILAASDNAPGDFTEEERTDPAILPDIERFIGKNAYVGVARFKRDVGEASNVGLLATTYNFIERHNHLGGVDGRLRLDKQTVFSFQALGTLSRRYFFDPRVGDSRYRTGSALGYYWNYDFTGRNFGYTLTGEGRTRDYRSDVGFVRRTNTNFEAAYFRVSNDPRPKATLISWRVIGGTTTNFDWQGRSQNRETFVNAGFNLTKQTVVSVNFGDFYERIFEEEFGPVRTATGAGAFFGDSERSTHGQALSAFAETNPSKKYSGSLFVGHRWNVFDFDFGAGPRFPRVSPAALADPVAPLDPGPANTFDVSARGTYQPTDALQLSVSFDRNHFTRNATGRDVFIDNIYSLRSTYQFTRFMFARVRVDYDTLASRVRGQYLFGWTPSPGTSLYVGYNDDMSLNGFSPFTGQHERGFRRNGRTFFVKTSYLIRKSV